MLFSPPEWLLIGAVLAVGVLHTIVPDHWVPITVVARQQGWTSGQTARAAAIAGTGHTLSTLAIAAAVWVAGVAVARSFGHWVDAIASLALIAFGGWIAISAWREVRGGPGHAHGRKHGHEHSHGQAHDDGHDHGRDHGAPHQHAHGEVHAPAAPAADARQRRSRTALLLILGSSPMVEGIPAFFAAGRYGPRLIVVMSMVFAAATILTYVVLSVGSAAGLQRLRLGPLERYGEVLSGAFIAAVGVVFWLWPAI